MNCVKSNDSKSDENSPGPQKDAEPVKSQNKRTRSASFENAAGKSGAKSFGTTFGAVVSFMGCMVGCGNVWRFPRIAAKASGTDGALMFVIVWLVCMVLWSTPMILIEYAIGRYTKKGIVPAFTEIMGQKFTWCGGWVAWVCFVVMAYFCVIVGWCIYYIVISIAFELPKDNVESLETFYAFTEESYWPVLMHAIIIIVTGMATLKGAKTIEYANMILVPLLLLIIVSTFIWSLTRPFATDGVKFMFTPDFSVLSDPNLWVDAATQSAFDTGAGMGMMVAYATYMPESTGIVKYSLIVPVLNNMISLLCGMTTFSTAFSALRVINETMSTGEILTFLQQTGPGSTGLTFVWIPVLFATAGEVVGKVFSVLFFISLCSAGLSSMLSAFEMLSKIIEDLGVRRLYAVGLTSILYFLGGLGSALSLLFLTNQDFVWAFALLISGLLLQFLVVKHGTSLFRDQVINNYKSSKDWYLPVIWEWQIKFICPLEAIFLIVWWAVDLIIKTTEEGRPWYEISEESFMITMIEWISAMIILILINVIVVCLNKRWRSYDLYPNEPIRYNSFPKDLIEDPLGTDTEDEIRLARSRGNSSVPGYGSVDSTKKEYHY